MQASPTHLFRQNTLERKGPRCFVFCSTCWLGFSLASHQAEHPVRGTQLNPFGPRDQTEFWEIQYLNVPALLHTNLLEREALVQIPTSLPRPLSVPISCTSCSGLFSVQVFPLAASCPKGQVPGRALQVPSSGPGRRSISPRICLLSCLLQIQDDFN